MLDRYCITFFRENDIQALLVPDGDVLTYILKAYYNDDEAFKLGGREYSFRKLEKTIIHQLKSEQDWTDFLSKLYYKSPYVKKSILGSEYYDLDMLNEHSIDVSSVYITRPHLLSLNHQHSASANENLELLKEVLERLKLLQGGQQITYDDLIEEIEKLKKEIEGLSSINLRRIIKGLFVEKGLGALSDSVIKVIGDSEFLKLR